MDFGLRFIDPPRRWNEGREVGEPVVRRVAPEPVDRLTEIGVLHYLDSPHAWVQWKGTNVCMDIHCGCGEMHHFDGGFAYLLQMPCGRFYAMCAEIPMVELTDPTKEERQSARPVEEI